MQSDYRQIGTLNEASDFQAYLDQLGIELEFDRTLPSGTENVLGWTYDPGDGITIGNRFCALPIEGSDANPDGSPSDLTHRRWKRSGASGAKLIWGGEATAVTQEGRSNPNQLMLTHETQQPIARLREELVSEHISSFGAQDDLLVGLQLSHAGRFAHPESMDKPEPVILHHHPDLDKLVSISEDVPVLQDDDIHRLEEMFIEAAVLAEAAGFDFVDIQHSNGSLGHEFLSAWDRPGSYGGSIENRTRFLREVVTGIQQRTSGLRVGVRLSLFDLPPFRRDSETGFGIAEDLEHPRGAMFGGRPGDPERWDLEEPFAVLAEMERMGIRMVNITAGCSYYNYHLTYPTYYPPLGAYSPPEDPLYQVARHIQAAEEVKKHFPAMLVVGSGYSYLQEWLPHVAHHAVRTGKTDFVGLGRALLSYPELPGAVLSGERIDRQRICRTYSDCITAPEMGLAAGCYPLDRHYMRHPHGKALRVKKREFRKSSRND